MMSKWGTFNSIDSDGRSIRFRIFFNCKLVMVTLSLLHFSLIIRSLKKSGFFLSRFWFWAGHIMMMLSHKTKNQTNIISLQTSLMIIWPNNRRKHPVFMLHTPSQIFSSLSKFIVVVGWSVQLFNNSSKCRLPAPFPLQYSNWKWNWRKTHLTVTCVRCSHAHLTVTLSSCVEFNQSTKRKPDPLFLN